MCCFCLHSRVKASRPPKPPGAGLFGKKRVEEDMVALKQQEAAAYSQRMGGPGGRPF